MGLLDLYNFYYYELADPRMLQYYLLRDLWPLVLILLSYVYFVFQYGPRHMKNKPAYKLKTFIRLYNIFQVVGNAYVVREFLATYPDATAFRCLAEDYSWSPEGLRVVRASYFGVILKIIDLVETGVFVLRKKNNQITFLHLYHHISTLMIAFMCARYQSKGSAVFFPILNCSVHVVMYTYYFLSSFSGIKHITSPIKRYITIMQMVQLVLLTIHTCILGLPSCASPKIVVYFMKLNLFLNFTLFYNFYKKAYLNSPKEKNKKY